MRFVIQGPLDCHIWQGATSPRGYPVMRVDGRVRQVRRVVYERERRPLEAGEEVKMECGERLCVCGHHMTATRRLTAPGDSDSAPGTLLPPRA